MIRCVALRAMAVCALMFAAGCGDCFLSGQPDCVGNHTVRVEDAQGAPLSTFDATFRIASQDFEHSFSCSADGDPSSSIYHFCTQDGFKMSHFDDPVEVTITAGGNSPVTTTITLSIRPASDTCSCSGFGDYVVSAGP